MTDSTDEFLNEMSEGQESQPFPEDIDRLAARQLDSGRKKCGVCGAPARGIRIRLSPVRFVFYCGEHSEA